MDKIEKNENARMFNGKRIDFKEPHESHTE